jgi:hypothetical protein
VRVIKIIDIPAVKIIDGMFGVIVGAAALPLRVGRNASGDLAHWAYPNRGPTDQAGVRSPPARFGLSPGSALGSVPTRCPTLRPGIVRSSWTSLIEEGPFPFLSLYRGTGNGPQSLRCQPSGVRRILPARSSDSSTSPSRSFFTERVSRSFPRLSVSPLGSSLSTCCSSPWRVSC